jgi:uncharacterized NAD(P)/FAD-binding protein YdhS
VEQAGDLEKGGDDVCAVGVRVLYGVYMGRQISRLLHRARRGGGARVTNVVTVLRSPKSREISHG